MKFADLSAIVQDQIRTMFNKTATFVPTLVAVLVILIVGWLIANIIKAAVTRGLKLSKVDLLSDKSGFTNLLWKGEIKYSLSELVGQIVYWIIMLVVFITAINAFGLTETAKLLDQVVLYIPNVIAAVFILVLGLFLATVLETIVRTTAINAGLGASKALAKAVKIIVGIFVVVIALEQLGIATNVINTTITIVLASIGIALGISFGLGCKDIAGKFVHELIDKVKK